jgi:uncharacterized RDD family membrane protein YckC
VIDATRTPATVDAVEQAFEDGVLGEALLDAVDEAIEAAADAGNRESLERLADLLAHAAVRLDDPALVVAAERARMTAEAHPHPSVPLRPGATAAVEPAASEIVSGWWRRVGAHVVDWVLISILLAMVSEAGAPALALLPLAVLYFAGSHAAADGQTVGKLVSGIAVRRSDGTPVDLPRALWRAALQTVLWFTVVGGVADSLWPLGEQRHRALHDLAAGTVVVRVR